MNAARSRASGTPVELPRKAARSALRVGVSAYVLLRRRRRVRQTATAA
jgi:hypothetical protein